MHTKRFNTFLKKWVQLHVYRPFAFFPDSWNSSKKINCHIYIRRKSKRIYTRRTISLRILRLPKILILYRD